MIVSMISFTNASPFTPFLYQGRGGSTQYFMWEQDCFTNDTFGTNHVVLNIGNNGVLQSYISEPSTGYVLYSTTDTSVTLEHKPTSFFYMSGANGLCLHETCSNDL
jgi:hypothetical protein